MINLRYILANWLKEKHGNDSYWGVSFETIGCAYNDEVDCGAIMCYPTKAEKYVRTFLIFSDRVVQYEMPGFGNDYAVIAASDPNFLDKIWTILERNRGHLNHLYNNGLDQYMKGYKPMNFQYPSPDIEIRNHKEAL